MFERLASRWRSGSLMRDSDRRGNYDGFHHDERYDKPGTPPPSKGSYEPDDEE
jgi:hypothetical protein